MRLFSSLSPLQLAIVVRPYLPFTVDGPPPTGILSLGCFAVQLLSYRALPRVRRTPGWLVLRAALCEAAVSACFVALYFFPASDVPTDLAERRSMLPPTLTVAPWAILLALGFFETAANAWRVLIYFDLLNVYRNPFAPDRHRALYVYPFAVVILGAGVTAGLYFYSNSVSTPGVRIIGLAMLQAMRGLQPRIYGGFISYPVCKRFCTCQDC